MTFSRHENGAGATPTCCRRRRRTALFGTVVILTRPVQWTANAFTVRFPTKVNRAH